MDDDEDNKHAIEILRDVFVEVRDKYREEWNRDATTQAKADIREALLALVHMRKAFR